VQVALFAELLGVAIALNFSISQVVEILTTMPSCSPALKVAAQSMALENYAPAFPIELLVKDLVYLSAGTEKFVPLTNTAVKVYTAAIEKKFGAMNMTAVAQLYT